jgi:hypothetical protein
VAQSPLELQTVPEPNPDTQAASDEQFAQTLACVQIKPVAQDWRMEQLVDGLH